jgi:putative MFS transporter
MRARLPESPRWLESVGRLDEAERITARMEREAERLGPLGPPAPSAAAVLPHPHFLASSHPHFSIIFTAPYRARTIMLSVCQVFQSVGYYGFGTLVPAVLAAKGYSIVTSLTFTSLTFIGYPVGSALSLPIIERIDRRWLIVGSAFLMSLFGLGLGFASAPRWIIAMGFLYTVSSNVFSNALHVFQVEIFPTFVRATAAGTAYGMSRLSSGAMPFILLPVLDRWGAGAMFAVIASALWIVMADIALFAPSTTGRPLEAVSRSQMTEK